MTIITTILAEGIPPGVLFAAAIAIVVAIANAVAKKKQAETTQEKMRSQRHAREGQGSTNRDRPLMDVIREQVRREHTPQGQMPKNQASTPGRKKGKQRQTATPPPMPGVRAAAPTPMPVQSEPETALVSRSAAKTETARNVRMLLQPAGIREAFILTEVMGKPKALRDE